jgi:hypothetical protein
MAYRKTCPNRIENHNRVKRGICMKLEHPWYKRRVSPKVCLKCTLTGIPPERPQEAHTEPLVITPLGLLIYARRGFEPPPCPPGYHMRSSHLRGDDVWVLEPDSPPCKHLKLSKAESGACGYHRIKRHCGAIESFVGSRTCGTCQRRE